LHPYIIARQDELLREWEAVDPDGIAVVDAALMIESGGYKRFDKLIVVHCRPEVQLQRLMLRNGLSREEAEKRISAQLSQEEKKKFADYLIDTSEGFADTRRQTEEVYAALRRDLDREEGA
jgi:dephospho-CoA kinase